MAGELLGSWSTDTTHNGVNTIAASANATGDIVSNDTKTGTEIGIRVTYGATITGGGVTAYLLREVASGVFQAIADSPFQWVLPVTASSTINFATLIDSGVGRFTIGLANPATNSSVTPTVTYRPHTWG
jgi:hypothetical protein